MCAASMNELQGVAIVGIAAELPSGDWNTTNLDYENFFKFLLEKGEAYTKIPIDRFNIDLLQGDGHGQVLTDTGAFLKDAHLIDYLEFGITTKDARHMPLGTRKLIETSFLSLVDSGIHYRGRNVGCYMSGVAHDMFAVSGHDDGEVRGSFASGPAMVANRVSYHLDLRGPSLALDTACSSSLYATHLAVQALKNGECEAAVVGGAQINLRFTEWMTYSLGGILSLDGKCKPFDASADGFGRAEGVVCMVLKPLDAALRDNDKIYGTILGSGVTSSGSLAPVNAPVASAQEKAMRRAFLQARCSPKEVDYIELHATGTAQGDPTEANWVGAAFQRDDDLIVGSVKGNVGHLEITAFLASLCKVCAMFQTRLIPPNVNLKNPNPAIHWKQYRLHAPTEVEPLACRRSSGQPLVAMASSGIGGANGHCVVEGPPVPISNTTPFWRNNAVAPSLIVAGGLSPRSAAEVAASVKGLEYLGNDSSLARVLGRRSRSMTWRSFAIASNDHLSSFSEASLMPKNTPPIVFVFPGQGPQHFNMGRDLYRTCSVFRDTIAELDTVYQAVTGQSLVAQTGLFDDILDEDPFEEIWPIAITLPALTMLQIALFDTMVALGIRPNIVVGHSAGETAVLYASGSGSKAMALELSIARGRAMATLEDAGGTMAALSCSAEDGESVIAYINAEVGFGVLDVGCINSPNAITLSGLGTHVDAAVKRATSGGIFARRLRTRIPVHSAMMEQCQTLYGELVKAVFAKYPVTRPAVTTYSAKSGTLFDTVFDAQYFWDSTRGPVQFASAIQGIVSQCPNCNFVELSPHPVLTNYVKDMAGQETPIVCPLRRPKSGEANTEPNDLLKAVGRLIVAGCNTVDFDVLCGVDQTKNSRLPPFPLARKDMPYFAPTAHIARVMQRRNGPLNYPQLQMNSKSHPALAGHVIKGEPIVPAAAYIEMALEFGAHKLWNVEFISMFALSSERPTPAIVRRDGFRWSVCSASSSDYMKSWPLKYDRVHAKGNLTFEKDPRDDLPPIDIKAIRARMDVLDMKGFYDDFTSFAGYGPTYRRIEWCGRGLNEDGTEEMLVQVRGLMDDLPDCERYRLHPAILDAAMHFVVHPLITGNRDPDSYYLPSKAESITVHSALVDQPFPRTVYTYGTFVKWTPGTLLYNLTLVTEEGVRLCSANGLEVALHGRRMLAPEKRFDFVHETTELQLPLTKDSTRSFHVDKINGQETRSSHLSNGSYVHGNGNGPTPTLSTNGVGALGRGPHDASAPIRSPAALYKLLSSGMDVPPQLFIEYKQGSEMDIQKLVLQLDALAELSVWFIATSGLDGDALTGFTRSLRREYQTWTVYCVVCDASLTSDQRAHAMHYLSLQTECELEVSIDAQGFLRVPRIVPTNAPSSQTAFRSELPWAYSNSVLRQIMVHPLPDEDHIRVQVKRVARGLGPFWAFLGRVEGTLHVVTGVTNAALSNTIVAHRGSLVELPGIDCDTVDAGPCVMASVIAVLAIGIAQFSHPERLKDTGILVAGADTELGAQISHIYARRGFKIITAATTAINTNEYIRLLAQKPRFIVWGSEKDRMLDELASEHNYTFSYDDPVRGLAKVMETDPWSLGDAIRCGLALGQQGQQAFSDPLDLVGPSPAHISMSSDVFDPCKSYLLIGGVGSLGLHIAYWMYTKGAREIVLTSRSGRDTIMRRGLQDFVARRLLTYLESLPDLRLGVEACDALSVEATTQMISRCTNPVGGCMMLSAILIDKSFASQTAETFSAPYNAKVGAVAAIEQVIPLASLDFIIAFSSISGLFGNGGQTNYASANTALSGVMRKFRNGFTLVVPAILDSAVAISADRLQASRMKHIVSWGMTASELCTCLEDGIRKLREETIGEYIPNFNWRVVRDNIGPSPVFNQLIEAESEGASDSESPSSGITLRDIICKVLDMPSEDLSGEVPLTSYGLDSLSAASLSHGLRPLLTISQLQLLADVTLNDLEERSSSSAMTLS